LPNPTQTLAISNPEPQEEEETQLSDFLLEFEDELFAKYENTSKYHTMRKPQKPSSNKEILDPSEEAFFKETMRELMSIISNEWLEESKFSSDVIHQETPSISIHCQINRTPFDTLYNPIVGVNIMSACFAHDLLKDMPITQQQN
jgi:hypothetical protein